MDDAFSKQKEETGNYEIRGTKRDYLQLLGLCSPYYLQARYKSLDTVLEEIEDESFKNNLVSYIVVKFLYGGRESLYKYNI